MKKLTLLLALFLVCATTVYAAGVDWSGDVISADGYGVPPQNSVNAAQSSILARRAAVVDGYRNLLEQIKDVSIDGKTTVESAMVSSDVVNASVSGFIKGAKVIKENWTPEGAYHVLVQVRMFGANGLASKVIPGSGIAGGQQPAAFPLSASAVNAGTVTGIVIDCRGMAIERAMAPAIYDENGRVIYSARYLSDEQLINDGICDYEGQDAMSMPNFRAGNRPLLLKALKLRDFNRNVVVSSADGDLILSANNNGQVLRNTRVVFLSN